jgi:hypothetical protein
MTNKPTQNKTQSLLKSKANVVNEALAKQLRKTRTEQKLTMRAIAGELGLPHSFVGKIEHQGRRMDVGEFVCYCQTMGKDPLVILKTVIAQSKS